MRPSSHSYTPLQHALDYDRALAELLELDDTVRATFAKLKELGELEDTLVVVTADHSHGFDGALHCRKRWTAG